ncbi:MAG: SufD family Fe-S cluster assembly protein [Candidatus Micrarchaeia archaeon]
MASIPLSEQARRISSSLHEPDWLLQKRLEAVKLLEKRNGTAEISGSIRRGKLSVKSKCEGGAVALTIPQALSKGNSLQEQFGKPFSGREPDAYLLSFALFTDAAVFAVNSGEPARIFAEITGKPPEYFAVFFLFADQSDASVYFGKRLAGSSNDCLGVVVGANANVEFCNLQQNGAKADSESGVFAQLGENSQLKFLNSNLGGRKKHEQVAFLQDGRGSKCWHFEASLVKGAQKIRKDSDHLHVAPDTYSRSIFKYATAGTSRVEVNGNVTIEQSAPGSDTHLLAKSLLLSKNSVSHIVPQLFVRNAKVMAGHGSSMMPIDDEELFYLRSRGIGEDESRLLVLQGFLQDLLGKSEMKAEILAPLEAEIQKEALGIFPRD